MKRRRRRSKCVSVKEIEVKLTNERKNKKEEGYLWLFFYHIICDKKFINLKWIIENRK